MGAGEPSPSKAACHGAIRDALISGAIDLVTAGIGSEVRAAARTGELLLGEAKALRASGAVRRGFYATAAGVAELGRSRSLESLAGTVQMAGQAEGAASAVFHPTELGIADLADLLPIPFVGFIAHSIDALVKCTQSGL